jgi:hypothetical protein
MPFEGNAEKLIKQVKSQKGAYENRRRHTFFVPQDARWSILSSTAENIGQKIDDVWHIIEHEKHRLCFNKYQT